MVQRLRDVLRQDGRALLLDTCLDTPFGFAMEAEGEPGPEATAGLTCWDATAPVKSQLKAAGSLHAIAEMGTAAVRSRTEHYLRPTQLVEWLHGAWRRTEVARLRFVRPVTSGQQLTLGLHAGQGEPGTITAP